MPANGKPTTDGQTILWNALVASEPPPDINPDGIVDNDHSSRNGQLEVDVFDDSDSAYAESSFSDLTSLSSSIHRGVWENGRRYNSYGREYAFPNDDQESERLDMQHTMHGHLLGDRLFWAPIDPNLGKALDLGTGTGIWAIDFADMFPSAEVTGTDLSPNQPSWVPPNCKFEIDDAESEWTFKRASFDYIHNRNFICAIRNWPKLIKQCFEFTRPGGWLELQEKHPYFLSDDGTITETCILREWSRNIFESAARFGTPMEPLRNLKPMMEEAGYVDVQEHVLKLPIGPWAKDPRLKRVGLFEMINLTEGITGLSLKLFTRMLGWTQAQVEAFLVDVRKEVKNRKNHGYFTYYVVFGRKPEV